MSVERPKLLRSKLEEDLSAQKHVNYDGKRCPAGTIDEMPLIEKKLFSFENMLFRTLWNL